MRLVIKFLTVAIISMVITVVSPTSGYTAKARMSAADKIDQAVAAGTLTRELGTLYKVYSVRSPEKIPVTYRTPAGTFERCATRIIHEAQKAASEFGPDIQLAIAAALARPVRAYSYDSPGGYYKIHYDTEGIHAVPLTDANTNGIPDYIENLGWYADSCWEHETFTLGWRQPPSDGAAGGDGRYDVYTENMSYYGYCSREGPGPEPWADYASYISVHNNFIGFPDNDDPDGVPAGAAKVTLAHEFNHACQYAYDAFNEFYFYELSATYMEDEVYDIVNDNYNYLGSFFTAPYTSLKEESYHAYSVFIFGVFLHQEFGPSIMPGIWDYMRYSDASVAVDQGLNDYSTSFSAQFPRFVEWNYFTEYRDDGLHYEEAGEYPYLNPTYTENSYPITRSQTSSAKPQGWAANYIRFNPGTNRILRLAFNGQNLIPWGITLIAHKAAGGAEFSYHELDPSVGDDTLYVPFFPDLDYVVAVVANMGPTTSGASYQYTATALRPGDVNDDGAVNPLDVTVLVNYVYRYYTGIQPHDSFGDCNCDDMITPLDVTILVNYVFKSGAAPCE
jgi:hypothetical protein